jgi:hypothetical protein
MSIKYHGLKYFLQTYIDWIDIKNMMVYHGYTMIFKYFSAPGVWEITGFFNMKIRSDCASRWSQVYPGVCLKLSTEPNPIKLASPNHRAGQLDSSIITFFLQRVGLHFASPQWGNHVAYIVPHYHPAQHGQVATSFFNQKMYQSWPRREPAQGLWPRNRIISLLINMDVCPLVIGVQTTSACSNCWYIYSFFNLNNSLLKYLYTQTFFIV